MLQQLLQCSLLVEKHCSNSNLKNGDGEVVGVSFWGEQWALLSKKIDIEHLLE